MIIVMKRNDPIQTEILEEDLIDDAPTEEITTLANAADALAKSGAVPGSGAKGGEQKRARFGEDDYAAAFGDK